MTWFSRLLRKGKQDAQLDSELRFHVEQQTAENIAAGMSAEEARRLALARFGGLESRKEEARDARGTHLVESLVQDVRFALRMLRKSPGFTAVAVLTLALGIGANTAIFSLVNGILLQSLPYPDSDRLVTLFNGTFPKGAFVGLRDLAHSANLAAFGYNEGFDFLKNGEPIRLEGTPVSSGFFSVFGVDPEFGRTFHSGEDTPSQDNVVVLSHKLWQQRFGADPNIIGHSIKLNDFDYEVIGIMPASFCFPSASTELWVPLSLDSRNAYDYWTTYPLQIVGRLQPNVSVSQAEAEFLLLLPRLRAMFPYPMASNWGVNFPVIPLQDSLVAYARSRLLLLLGGVALVLLIACANVANLLLARTETRQREIAVRLVLGAGRWRLLRQFVMEAIPLALAGGALGFFLAKWTLPLLLHWLPQKTAQLTAIALGLRVLGFTAGLALVIGVIFGVLSTLRVSRAAIDQTLRANATGAGTARARHKLTSTLLVGELATAVVVTVCAALLGKSLWKLSQVNPGFHSNDVATERITPTAAFCSVPNRCLNFYNQVVERTKNLPGIEAAAVVNVLPLSGNAAIGAVTMEGHPVLPGSQVPLAWENAITPDYLRAMRIELIEGRNFTDADTATSARVALVNASMVRHFWPGENPIGKHVNLETTASVPCTIVGVVNDVREFWLQGDPNWFVGEVYLPYAQTLSQPHAPGMYLIVRTQAAKSATAVNAASLRQAIAGVNPDVPTSDEESLDQIITENISAPASTAWLFAIFALLALALSTIGVYGVMSYSVVQQTHDIGVRMALGAQRKSVLQLVLGHGGKMALVGVAIGVAAATALTRLIKTMLFGVSATDPIMFISVSVLLLLVALAACYIPARRAMRVDPMIALRYE